MSIKPKGQVDRYNVSRPAITKIIEPEFEIAAYSPGHEKNTRPTEVHFIIHWAADETRFPPMVIRFKGPDTIGFFIEELTKFRRFVWPNSEKVEGEK